MPVYNKTNTTGGILDQNPPLEDAADFTRRTKFAKMRTFAMAIYDINMATAIILALIGVLLFLTILNQKLRSQSQLWYVYHLIAMTTFVAFVLHAVFHSNIQYDSKEFCKFITYSTEYALAALGVNIVLINAEVYFTSMLPLKTWQSNQFLRFIVLIFTSWIFVCLFVTHVVIANNDSHPNASVCFYILDKSIRNARYIVRTLVPTIVCFLFTIAFIVTYILKKSRVRFISAPGQFREVTSVCSSNGIEWLRFIVFLNGVFIARTVIMMVMMYTPYHKRDKVYVYTILSFRLFHSASMYMFPLAMLFLAEVRESVKAIILKVIALVSFGKLRFGGDLEVLSVSFGQVSENSVS